MSHLNWLNKLQSVLDELTAAASQFWEIGAIVAMFGAICAIIIAMKVPSKREAMKSKARLLRYCHNCPHSDLFTETCKINADFGEKCGLIDETAGFSFTVTRNEE